MKSKIALKRKSITILRFAWHAKRHFSARFECVMGNFRRNKYRGCYRYINLKLYFSLEIELNLNLNVIKYNKYFSVRGVLG